MTIYSDNLEPFHRPHHLTSPVGMGPRGLKGEKGDKGDKGDKGEKGNKGDTGSPAGWGVVAANINSGVGTPSVEVMASGPNEAKNLNFFFRNLKGNKGDKGDTGEQGPQGIQGEKGDRGDAFTFEDFTTEQLDDLRSDMTSVYYRKDEATYTTTANFTNAIVIPFSDYRDTDMLFVDIEGLALTEGEDYTIVTSPNNGNHVCMFTTNHGIGHAGTDVHFKRLTALAIDPSDFDDLSDDMFADAVNEWLTAHPEATTTVQDNSITDAKLVQTGGVLSEVIDIRTGYDGTTYASAGNAVRGQVTDVKSAIEQTSQFLAPSDHVTGKYVNETGEVTSNNFEYFVYEIPSYCSQIKFATNIYGPGRIVLSTVSDPDDFLTNPYVTYPAASYESPTDYSNTVNCDGYKYIFVPHYIGDAKSVSVNAFLSNRLDVEGQNISTLKSNQPGLMTGNDVEITQGKYVNYENGNIGTIAEAGATDAIPVISGAPYVLTLASSIRTDSRGIAFYKDGGFITGSGIRYISGTTVYSFTVPDDANQIRLTVMLRDEANKYFSLQAVKNLTNLTTFINKAIEYKITETVENVFSFNTVGIVGDSLASGCSNYKDDQDVWHALDRKAFAWGKFLEKRQGCSVTLFSQGGMDTRTWFSNANGYAKAINNPCECYFIGLGVNDFASLKAAYLGTIADVHIGSEDNNEDTFYGNYSKIIAKLTEIQPRCKIFCLTMPGNQGSSQTKLDYDTAIRTVTALYDNAYLLDLTNDPFFVSSPLTDTWYGAHYLSTGYSLIADHMLEVTNKYMLAHLDDFADIQWITNNWPNVDIVT